MSREFQAHLILFSELIPYYFSSFDREMAYNSNLLRDFIRSMIQDRRKVDKETLAKKSDLLSIMI
jgi:cytochrome P450